MGACTSQKGPPKKQITIAERIQTMQEHKMPLEELCEQLDIDSLEMGLSNEEAAKRLQREGPNDIRAVFGNSFSVATVIRSGRRTRVRSLDIVRGDIVYLTGGDSAPADIRVFESREMEVFKEFKSNMTSVKEMLPRSAECTHPDDPLNTQNLIFCGYTVGNGSGKGIVIFTGSSTFVMCKQA